MPLIINRMDHDDIAARRKALLARTPFTMETLRTRRAQGVLTPEESAILRGLENLAFLESGD